MVETGDYNNYENIQAKNSSILDPILNNSNSSSIYNANPTVGFRKFTPVDETLEFDLSENTISNMTIDEDSLALRLPNIHSPQSTIRTNSLTPINASNLEFGQHEESKNSLLGLKSTTSAIEVTPSFHSAEAGSNRSPNRSPSRSSSFSTSTSPKRNRNRNRIDGTNQYLDPNANYSPNRNRNRNRTRKPHHDANGNLHHPDESFDSVGMADTSLPSISRIDSAIVRELGDDSELLELGYLSAVAGLGEAAFIGTNSRTNSARNSLRNSVQQTELLTPKVEEVQTPVITVTKDLTTSPLTKSRTNTSTASSGKTSLTKSLRGTLSRKFSQASFKLKETFDFSFDDGVGDGVGTSDDENDAYSFQSGDDFHTHDNDLFTILKNNGLPVGDYLPSFDQTPARSCIRHDDEKFSVMKPSGVGFVDDVKTGYTYGDDLYDRSNPDMKKVYIMMTYYPREIRAIRMELNEYKEKEMEVNEESKQYTHTFLV